MRRTDGSGAPLRGCSAAAAQAHRDTDSRRVGGAGDVIERAEDEPDAASRVPAVPDDAMPAAAPARPVGPIEPVGLTVAAVVVGDPLGDGDPLPVLDCDGDGLGDVLGDGDDEVGLGLGELLLLPDDVGPADGVALQLREGLADPVTVGATLPPGPVFDADLLAGAGPPPPPAPPPG